MKNELKMIESKYRDLIEHDIQEAIEVKKKLLSVCKDEIIKASYLIIQALKKGNKLITFGNGGSAADAQHLAAEFVGRYITERRGLPAIALTTNTSNLTAIGNDYGYEEIFRRQVEALANPGDVLFAISTSGNSDNILRAIEEGKKAKCKVIGLTGKDGGKMLKLCDCCMIVPSKCTPRIQENHIFIIHFLCSVVDGEMGS